MKRSILSVALAGLLAAGWAAAQDQPQAKRQTPAPAPRAPMQHRMQGPMGAPQGEPMMCPCMDGPGQGAMMGPGMMGPGMMGPGMMGPGMMSMRPGGGEVPGPFVMPRRFGPRGGPMGRPDMHMFGGRLRQELNLTDQQTSRLRQLGVEQEKKTIRERADLQIKELELHELMRADNPDRSAIDAKISEIGALRTQMMKDHAGAHLNLLGTLTPEQKQKLRQMRERRPGGEFGPGMRGGPRRPPRGAPPAPPKPPAPPQP